jgi:hypothetical protein
MYRILPAFAILLVLAACKSTGTLDPFDKGSRQDITAARVTLATPITRPVSVAVTDERPYVLEGGESRRFLGTERGSWGAPVAVTTESGQSLAEDLTAVVTEALRRAGAAAAPLALPDKADAAEAKAAFAGQSTDRLLLIQVADWRADAYTRLNLQWRFDASVYDHSGKLLGHSAVSGKEPLGGTTLHDNGEAIVVHELSRRLSDLLQDPGVVDALR